ncbi:MAG: SDR family NAD(P)-dependent oxidoreductase, partial [Candidatus Paceibacterota bacterium]
MSESSDNRKVFLITGTSRGVGKYLAEYYTNLGNDVIGCSRGASDFEAESYKHFKVDISDEKNIQIIFSHIRKEYKKLDVVINNVVSNPVNISSALLNYKSIEETFRVNLFSTMIICREAIKLMIRAKSG